ncbi:hypothetical protein GOBAR_DD03401 [Gossypium barbadense]|nr:hypothetical protein GOBAR_DD03401 [Gossypium barbadense]
MEVEDFVTPTAALRTHRDVEILKMATIADLKLAVEHVFSQMPDQGLGEISWPHVWGHFCLCYDAQKLVSDTDLVVKYGIRDGHQLHFVRHVSSIYNLTKTRSKRSVARKRPYLLKSTSSLKSEKNVEEINALDDDIANQRCHSLKKNHSFTDNKNQSPITPQECQFRHSWKGFYSYSRMPSIKNRATSSKGRAFLSKYNCGFLVCTSEARLGLPKCGGAVRVDLVRNSGGT